AGARLVRGDDYRLAGRWQQLSLRQPVKRLREQQQLLQAELKRDVLTTDAYVDRVVLNLYAGPGQVDAYVDDLEVGPLSEGRPAAEGAAPVPRGPGDARGDPAAGGQARPAARRAAEVQLRGSRLLVSGQRFFPRVIRATGTP